MHTINLSIGLPDGVAEEHRAEWLPEEASQLGKELLHYYAPLVVGVAFGPNSVDHHGNAEPRWVDEARRKIEPAVRKAIGI
jgi:hypothetical protein